MVFRFSSIFLLNLVLFCRVFASQPEGITEILPPTSSKVAHTPSRRFLTDHEIDEFSKVISDERLQTVFLGLTTGGLTETDTHIPNRKIYTLQMWKLLESLTDRQRNMLLNWVNDEQDDQELLHTELATAFIRAHQNEDEVLALVRGVLPKVTYPCRLDHIIKCVVNRFEDRILYYDSKQYPHLVDDKLDDIIQLGFKYQNETFLLDYFKFLLEKFNNVYIDHARKYQNAQIAFQDIGIEPHAYKKIPREVRHAIGRLFTQGFINREAPVKKKIIAPINILLEKFRIPSKYQLKLEVSPDKTQRLR